MTVIFPDALQEPRKLCTKKNLAWCSCLTVVVVSIILVLCLVVPAAKRRKNANFENDFYIMWAQDHTRLVNHGETLELMLDNISGSGFTSKEKYLFGSIKMQIKLVPGDSAGTVTAYYLSSQSANHDELDFEFLGNVSGQPYILQTNVFANGTGGREQRIFLWFDPTLDFHTYGVFWNRHHIIFQVDDYPIRIFTNNEDLGMAYLDQQPMNIFSSIWNGDQWATQGGRIKVDWTQAPFIASYQNYQLDACAASDALAACAMPTANNWWDQPSYQTLASNQVDKVRWLEQNYMVYNYCTDTKRNPTPPIECAGNS